MTTATAGATIERIGVRAFEIPTQTPEADGTARWKQTTLVLADITAEGQTGLGMSYADRGTAQFISDHLAGAVRGRDAFDIPAAWAALGRTVRNQGRPGVASMAIAAVDNALWDLKARLLDVPLATLLGRGQDGVRLYGSGGFTSFTVSELEKNLRGFVDQGLTAVKMKIGEHPPDDVARVKAARKTIGSAVALFVDANGAYRRKEALAFADAFADLGVSWFEEPVSSDDLDGLRLIRDRAPAGLDIAAGEYGYDVHYFRRMLDAGAVDVLQADVTRCEGISGFLSVAALCRARSLPLSGHTSPSQHLAVACALPEVIHLEYFFDHARIERMLFDGCPSPRGGRLYPDLSAPGNGLTLKEADADKFKVYEED